MKMMNLSGLGKKLLDKQKKDGFNFCIWCFNSILTVKKEKNDWVFKCHGCGFKFNCLTQATKLTLFDERCNKCASRIVEAEYAKEITPFPDR